MKGQVSMEFMSYFGLLLLIFAIFTPIFLQQSMKINERKNGLIAEQILTTVEKEINMALTFGDGYSRNFTLPGDLSGYNYSLSLRENTNMVELAWSDKSLSKQIIGMDFEGSPEPGRNIIKNQDGKIVFVSG